MLYVADFVCQEMLENPCKFNICFGFPLSEMTEECLALLKACCSPEALRTLELCVSND